VLSWYDWKFDEGEAAFKRAISLDPVNANALRYYGALLLARGRFHEAVLMTRESVRLAPLSPTAQVDLGFAFFFEHQYAEAIRQAEKALTLNPSYARAYALLSWIHTYTGDYKQARTDIEIAIAYGGSTPLLRSHLAIIDARDGRPAPARKILQELIAGGERGDIYVLPLLIARVCVAVNDFAEARSWLDKALEDRSESMVWLGVDPWIEPLRAHGGLDPMIKSIGR
jgi:Flp pilus assembly protein TadD